jgi:iron complex outermembrane receptor protein
MTSSNESLLRRRLLAGPTLLLGLFALAGPALAQTQPQATPGEADSAAVEEVIVTGSSIKGVAPVGSPLTAVTREEIKQVPATNATELLRSSPTVSNFNATGGNRGADQANIVDQPAIHGIGVGNGGGGLTLVLFNGHRLPGAGVNQSAPDPGSIPPGAIERVEVVADGASSVYGSDAVAGVINFITRKNFDGAETSANYGAADGYSSKSFNQLFGKTWDGGSLLLNYAYSGNSHLSGTERDYITDNQTAFGGTDNRSTICAPANVTVGGTTYALSGNGATAGATNRCEANKASDLYPKQHRHQALASFTQDINDKLSVYGSSLYSRREVYSNLGVNSRDNAKRGLAVTVTQGPAYDYVTTVLGVPAGSHSVTYDPTGDFGATMTNRTQTRTVSSLLGAEYQLGGDWTATAEVNQGFERDIIRQYGINQALVTSAAANGSLNPYGVGPATSEALLRQIGDYESRYSVRQTLVEGLAKVQGTLFQLPAGGVKGAFGVTRRQETFAGTYREGPQNGSPVSTPLAVRSERNITSVYGEVFVPVIGAAQDVAFARSIDVSLSLRYDDFDDVGSTTNPKIGVNWELFDGFKLRGSYGTSFHAPSLADSTTAIDTRAIRFADFTGSTTPGAYSIVLAGGNTLKPEEADTYSLGFDFKPVSVPGLSASVGYFKINYKNVITFPGFNVVTEPNNPLYSRYRIYNPTAAQVTAAVGSMRHDGLVYPDVAALPTAVYDLRRQNFATQVIEGFDFDLRYRVTTEVGTLGAGIGGTRLTKFDQTINGDTLTTSRLDTGYALKLMGRGNVSWSQGPYTAVLFGNYTDSYINTNTGKRIKAFKTADLHLAYAPEGEGLMSGIEVSLDVSNLFDQDPPTFADSNASNIDFTRSNPIGRMWTVGLRKRW